MPPRIAEMINGDRGVRQPYRWPASLIGRQPTPRLLALLGVVLSDRHFTGRRLVVIASCFGLLGQVSRVVVWFRRADRLTAVGRMYIGDGPADAGRVDPPGLIAHLAARWQEPTKRDRR
jgi:hypothetical protein